MPQPLHVDTAELRKSADQLDALNDTTTTQLRLNAHALTDGQAGWAGTTFAAFEQVRETWERADAARAEHIDDIMLNLHRSANIYDHRDEAHATDINTTM